MRGPVGVRGSVFNTGWMKIKGFPQQELGHLVLEVAAPTAETILHVSISRPCDCDRCPCKLLSRQMRTLAMAEGE